MRHVAERLNSCWVKTGRRHFQTRFGTLEATITRTALLDELRLVRHHYTLGPHEWVIETAPGNRPSLFDIIAYKFYQGDYLGFAQWGAEHGVPDDQLTWVYIHKPHDDVTVVVDPMYAGLVEFLFLIGGERYFVSVTPQTPVGLLAKISMEVRRR